MALTKFLRRAGNMFKRDRLAGRTGKRGRPGRSEQPRLEQLEDRLVPAGTWTAFNHLAPAGIGSMMLLTDGTVMAQGGGVSRIWYKLTPGGDGSYATSGTWSALNAMSLERLYTGSNILKDGRAFVVGGEYSGSSGAQNLTNTGEIYNPLTNSWSSTANFPQTNFGDDPTMLLDDGRVLAGYVYGPQTYLYDPSANTWTATGTKLHNGDRSDEETWLKLPDGSVLSYDVWNTVDHGLSTSQRYIPSTGTWVDAGIVPVTLSSSALGYELGGATMLADGRAWFVGCNGHTAFYTPSTNSWAAGPNAPGNADDAPLCLLTNGKVLLGLDGPGKFFPPTHLYEYDPVANTFTLVDISGLSTNYAAYNSRMLALPNGRAAFVVAGSNQVYAYSPDSGPSAAWAPTITDIEYHSGASLTVTGTRLNGISAGASYGDDAEMDSNYPLVRLQNIATGTYYFARTTNWTTTSVATAGSSTPMSVDAQLPSGLPGGKYNIWVIANGIASTPVLAVIGTSANDTITIGSSGGSPAVTFNGSTTTYTASSYSAVYAMAEGGTNTINVQDTYIHTVVSSGGPDTVIVGHSNSVQTINGYVEIENSPDFSTIYVYDSADTTARTVSMYTYDGSFQNPFEAGTNWGAIVGLSPAFIGYEYGDTNSVTVYAGTASDAFTVSNTGVPTTIASGSGNDTVKVLGTGAGDYLNLNNGGGRDLVYVGSNGGSGGTMQGINGYVYAYGAGETWMYLYDDGDSAGRTVDVYNGSLYGLAPATIYWSPSATTSGGVDFVGVYEGSGPDTTNVHDTSNFFYYTYISTGNGGDTINVLGTTGALQNYNSGSDRDIVNIGNGGLSSGINGKVFNFGTGETWIYIYDYADSTGRTVDVYDGSVTGITPTTISWFASATQSGGVDFVGVYEGSGADTTNAHDTSNFYLYTYISTGNGGDSVNVLGTTGTLWNYNSGSDRDRIFIGNSGRTSGINGNVFNYGTGETWVYIQDTADSTGRTVDVYDGSVTGIAAATISWSPSSTQSGGVDFVGVYTGSGADNFNVHDTSSFFFYTYLNTGNGGDSVNVLGTTGTLWNYNSGSDLDVVTIGNGGLTSGINGNVVNFGAGQTWVYIDDSADSTARTVDLYDGSVTGIAPATISWTASTTQSGGVDFVGLFGGSGGNTYTVHDTSNFFYYTRINTGAGDDVVNVLATTGNLYVQNDGGVDSVYVGSNGSSPGGTMANINGWVDVYGAGSTYLYLMDDGDSTGRSVAMNDGVLTGLSAGAIYWSPSSSATGGVTSLQIQGGSGGNTFTVNDTSNFYYSTYLSTGTGSDIVNVLATQGYLSDDNPGGQDYTYISSDGSGLTGTLANINGTVNVLGAGATYLYVSDAGDATGRTAALADGSLSGLSTGAILWTPTASIAGGVTYLYLDGGSGGNTWNVSNTSNFLNYTYLLTGAGDDTVNVTGTTGFLYNNNDGGTDTTTIGSLAPALGGTLAAINGGVYTYGAGATTLIVDDSGDLTGRTATIAGGTITGLSAGPLYYAGGVSSVTIYGGKGADTFNIQDTSVPLSVKAGAGNDTFNVGSATGILDGIQGPLSLDGGNNSDTFNATDTGAGAPEVYTLDTATLTRSGAANISYANDEQVNLSAGAFNDSLTLLAVPAVTTTFAGGGGSDTLTAPNTGVNFTINAANGGTMGVKLTFSSVENLVGGTAGDTFKFGVGGSLSGTLNGGVGGGDKLDYSGNGSVPVTVNLKNLSATSIFGGAAGGIADLESFVGSGASDNLLGPNANTNWSITSVNGGKAGAVFFSGFENLTGGSNKDTFRFNDGMKVTGSITGGNAEDTLDFSAYTAAVTVNSATGACTGADGGVQTVENVFGGSAGDSLTGDANANVILGNGGGDAIIGGGGNDVLVGGDGNDTVTGGPARSILIGGNGSDNVTGGADQDILIGGATTNDTNVAKLENLRKEWVRTDAGEDYNTRISHLRSGGGANGSSRLKASTVFDDGVADTLTGGAELDWFWANPPQDTITDLTAGEIVR